MYKALAAFLALVAPLSLFGSLTWDRLSCTVGAKATDTEATAVYSFRNTGKDKVTIREVRPSCGCTTVELTKHDFAPGEGGSIKVVFTFGERVGKQHKTVAVYAKNGSEDEQALLEMFVDIPESVTINPRIHFWTLGDKPTPRPMVVKLGEAFTGRPVKAYMFAEHSNFEVVQPELQPDGSYRIVLTPKTTDHIDTEAGEIVVEIPGVAEPKKFLFYASVR